ncbi:TPA: major capsid family protein [Burkholderia cenocepacia]
MAFQAFSKITPSHTEPRLLLSFAQKSGAFNALAGRKPKVQTAQGDKAVYVHKLQMKSDARVNQSGAEMLPTPTFATTLISTPMYTIRNRAEWDMSDVNAAGNWGVALPEAYTKASRHGHFNVMRRMLLNGVRPADGEGLINTPNATAVVAPADAAGNSTLMTMDPDFVYSLFLQLTTDLRTRIMAISQGNIRISILAPQRVIGRLQQTVVELTGFQRVGAGSASIAGALEQTGEWDGISFEFSADDTLVGAGAGGADLVIINAPELVNPQNGSAINTNEFATLQPSLEDACVQYADRAAPTEFPTPVPGMGAVDVMYHMEASSGWCLRPEALTLLSLKYK